MTPRICLLTLVTLFFTVTGVAAQDGWVQVSTPNFTVVANGGDKRARDIALQFERYRAAVLAGWPWARQQFDRPVVVLAAKDEATMKLLAPQYWEKGSRTQPASVFATAPDAYFIALRSDVREDDNADSNPYQTSYWSYTSLALATSFEHPLPLWFRNGFATVLSNSIVRNDHIDFGKPPLDVLRTLATNVRLTTTELLTLDAKSSYYTDSQTRPNFDAQSWAVMHYLLFGSANTRPDAANQLTRLLLAGKSSVDAVTEVFGSVAALENEFVVYRRKPIYQYARVEAPNTVSASSFTTRALDSQQVMALRARYHLAMGRNADARALADTLKSRTPAPVAALDIDAVLLDREGKREEARDVYAKAVEGNTESFYSLYRLASLELQSTADAAKLARLEPVLRRSIASNGTFAPSHTLLANVLTSQNKADEAVTIATRAAVLAPADASARLALARALWAASRRDEARGHALAARSLADSDQERAAVQSTLDFFERSAAASRPVASAAGQGAPPAATPQSGIGPGVYAIGAGGVTPPRLLQPVNPQYTREALANRIQGVVRLEVVVLPDGSAGNVRVVQSLDREYGLDEEAIKAARQWRFEPGTREGVPVPVLVNLELTFALRDTPPTPNTTP